jgi:DsbC/DsbD-like thiol-disulfide interchange protein
MIVRMDRLRRTAAACAIGLLGSASCATAADDASAWDGDARSAVRLLAGSAASDPSAPLRAGIEIRLEPGWHTYWRYPGDAGVPPRFEFSGSQNLKSIEVHWPAPQRITEQGLTVFGYVGALILPLAIVPQHRGRPVTLRLRLDYGVCEKLCVPAQAQSELALPASRSSHDRRLAEAEARVPKKAALGEGAILAIRSVRHEPLSPRGRVTVEVSAPAGSSVALFAEGPTPDWALPVPLAEKSGPAGLQRFGFDLDGAPPGAEYRGALITLTAVTGEQAIEVSARLD